MKATLSGSFTGFTKNVSRYFYQTHIWQQVICSGISLKEHIDHVQAVMKYIKQYSNKKVILHFYMVCSFGADHQISVLGVLKATAKREILISFIYFFHSVLMIFLGKIRDVYSR